MSLGGRQGEKCPTRVGVRGSIAGSGAARKADHCTFRASSNLVCACHHHPQLPSPRAPNFACFSGPRETLYNYLSCLWLPYKLFRGFSLSLPWAGAPGDTSRLSLAQRSMLPGTNCLVSTAHPHSAFWGGGLGVGGLELAGGISGHRTPAPLLTGRPSRSWSPGATWLPTPPTQGEQGLGIDTGLYT